MADSQALLERVDVTGWVMLDTIPPGFELWRQFNAFPPAVGRKSAAADAYGKTKDGGDEGKGEKSDKAFQIKRRAK